MISTDTSKPRVIDTFGSIYYKTNVNSLISQARWLWRLWFVGLLGITFVIALMMLSSGPTIDIIGWIIFLLGAVVILFRPRYGIYMVVFFTLVGDPLLTWWFPFAKNFSSRESLLFLHKAIIFSPLEVYLILTGLSWFGRNAMQRKFKIYFSPLFWPMLLFSCFVAFGLGFGLIKGGDLNVALWESRAIFYLPLIMILTSNLLEKRSHFSNLMWFVMASLFIEALIGCYYYFVVLQGSLAGVERISAHAAAIHFNTFFIYLVSVWVFRASWAKRLILPLMVPFFLITYIAMQRRAAFLTLGIGILIIIIILFQENRKLFFALVPVIGVVAVIYLGIFWNSNGALGMPAQAVKSIIASDQANAKDRSSDLYRLLENYNALFNIRLSPLLGSGFGQKLVFAVPLPDISHFKFWEYIIHNSIAWVWIKTGFFGFYFMLFLVGSSIMTGMRAIIRVQDPNLKAIVFTASAYIVMHFTYAYADMSWDVESMIYMGTMIGIVGCIEHVAEKPVPVKTARWPWQSVPEPVPGLLPIPDRK